MKETGKYVYSKLFEEEGKTVFWASQCSRCQCLIYESYFLLAGSFNIWSCTSVSTGASNCSHLETWPAVILKNMISGVKFRIVFRLDRW